MKKRIAIVKRDKCYPHKCGDYLCVRLCPINRTGEECIVKREGKAAINEELCTGCGICQNRCPFEAIDIINLSQELDENPIHQYGENQFRLYKLPVPIFGKVVGIIGRNGIGKSTAINILSGNLKPNFGDLGKKDMDYDELIENFKGTEAQLFFEKMKKGKIKVAYKPQSIDMIPKQFDGKVRELLGKVDEKKEMKKIAKELDLEKVLERKISEISGGELQRVAIAATVLKKANVYFFDEPTSYLDIKQRIKVASFIKNLINEDTAVMIVEHDLIILDHMTDLIHIMYGKEGAYGVVSSVKATKTGINVYLSGYLKEENVRFRDNIIKFSPHAVTKKGIAEAIISWEGIKKKLDNFSLESEKGEIHKKRVIGVLGENGIGKTTFIKILANVIKSDSGKIEGKIKVSYKPQYLDKSDDLVSVALKDVVSKYNTQLIGPLNIQPLLLKKLNQLSGGELQRVAIAYCLAQEADLYLLDEPSAYLDIEQRLIVSKIIKDRMESTGKTSLVVDHDLLFIDYLSDELMIIEGEPAIKGKVNPPVSMQDGMNKFLKDLNITLRRDPENLRPRVNKTNSQMDNKQKSEGKLYYT